jgi:bla regulator protein blaR1
MDAAFGGMASVVQLLGLVLLHFLWQGALVGAVFGLLRRVLPGGSPRYTAGLVCFAALIAAPLITALVLSLDSAGTAVSVATASSAIAAAGTAAMAGQPAGAWQQWMDYLPWLVALWGAGVAVLSLRALLHWHGLNRLIRNGSLLPEWNERLSRLCAQFGVGKVGLLYSAKVQTPTLAGWIRPVILLPAAVALGFPVAQIELILAHELGHLRRWDHIVNLVQVIAETVLFYHPVVHWISHDLRDQREICCDELVLRMSKASPRDYVATLADLEQLRLDGPGALALSATGGVLLERVQHIAKVPTTQFDLRAPVRLLPLLVVSLAVIVLGYTQRAAWENSTMLALLAPQSLREVLLRDPAQIRSAPPVVADMLADRTLRLPRLPLLAEPVAEPVAPPAAEAVPASAAETVALSAPALVEPKVIAAVPPPAAAVATPVADAPAPAALQPTRIEATAVREPIAAHAVQPAYPERALLRGAEGSVKLSYIVDDAGRVRDVRVEQSTPAAMFDSAALTALRKWRFVPGSFEAGTRRYTRQFVFALNGASASAVEESVDANDCRLITGTRICRRAGDLGQVELQATAALD